MIYCMKCGKPLPDSAMFCNSCGASTDETSPNYYSNNSFNRDNYNEPIEMNTPVDMKEKGIGTVVLSYLTAIISYFIFVFGGRGIFWIGLVFISMIVAATCRYKHNYCPRCYAPKSMSEKHCHNCRYVEHSVVPLWLTIILYILLFIIFFIVGVASATRDTQKSSDYSSTTSKITNKYNRIEYQTYLELKKYEDIILAVEDDGFNGYICKSGLYKFDNVNKEAGKAGIYNIYIRSNENYSIEELGEADYEIGGINGIETDILLNKGDYIYIIPYRNLVYEPDDSLVMTYKESESNDFSDIINEENDFSESNDESFENKELSDNEQDITWFNKKLGLYLSTVEMKGITQYGTITIYGGVGNASSKDYEYVEITFSIYDDNGNKTGDAIANTLGLKSGEKWHFEAVGISGSGTKYKFESISAW